MIGNLLTRGLVMIFGYAYPAYECFKTVEKNKPEIEQLRFWCQYWILVALMTVFERVGDTFVSWVPMYSEAKLAFIIYLWYPKTKGTTYVYQSFFRPYIAKHETNIDRNLMELRTRAGDVTFMYFQKVAICGQTRIFEILQFIAAKSSPRPHATQPQQPAPRSHQSPAPPKNPAKKTQAPQPQQNEEPPSPTSSSSSSTLPEKEEEVKNVTSSKGSPSVLASPVPSHASTTPPKKSISTPGCQVQASSPLKKSVSLPSPPTPASSCQSTTNNETKESTLKIEPIPPASPKVVRAIARTARAPRDTVLEENVRVTRGRLRKAWSTTTK